MRHASMSEQVSCDIMREEDKIFLMALGMSAEEYNKSLSREPSACPTCGDDVCPICGRHSRGACPTALIEAVMET